MNYLEFKSHLELKDLTPKDTLNWENIIEKKEEIDNLLKNIENQIENFENLGINYFINPYKIKNEELQKYVIDMYKYFLEKIGNYISIINLDSIISLPSETVKVFKAIYFTFFADGYDDIYLVLHSSNIDKHYIARNYFYIKNVLVNYFENVIKSLQKLKSLLQDKTAINLVNKSISRFYTVKSFVEATDDVELSKFALRLIGNDML